MVGRHDLWAVDFSAGQHQRPFWGVGLNFGLGEARLRLKRNVRLGSLAEIATFGKRRKRQLAGEVRRRGPVERRIR